MRDDLEIPMPIGGPSYRVSRGAPGLDKATRLMLIVAAGVGGTLLLLIGGWSIAARHSGGVPVIEAAAGPIRVKPDKPGGLNVFGADETVTPGEDPKEAMAPPPEAPDPQALRAQERQAAQATPPAVHPAPPSTSLSLSTSPAPVAAPATPPTPLATAAPAAALPHPEVLRAVAPTATDARPKPADAPAAGAVEVQLAALTTEQGAMAEWTLLSHRMPDLLGGRHPTVSRIERDGKTWFRLRTSGFADIAQATEFCQHVREKGGGCSLASF